MIKLALEIPTSLLKEISPLTDFDFVLAHRVLEDTAYAEWFRNRVNGRELLLDNSLHELGAPLPAADLVEAALRCQANFVIAPDRLGDGAWTLEQLKETLNAFAGTQFGVALCLQGSSYEERAKLLAYARGRAALLCLPYRENRIEWFMQHDPSWRRVHLLGMSTFEELIAWKGVVRQHPRQFFSIDTAKPLKAALVGRYLDDGKSVRGIPISSKDLLGMTATAEQLELVRRNISILRGALAL